MNMHQTIWKLLLVLVLPISTTAETSQDKGLAIAQEVDRRDSGFTDSTANMRMILRNRHGEESIRDMRVHKMEVQHDGDKSLLIFDSPKDVKGTAFLTHTHKIGDDDQWLYLPALKRVKRISSRNKSGSFMGSEFAYEDVAGQEVEKYSYRWIRAEVLDGRSYFVVEYYPIDKKNSGYHRQVKWIDQQAYRVWKVEYYDRKDAHPKTLRLTDYRLHLNRFWRPGEMLMHNHQSGKSTLIRLMDYRFQTGLSARIFSKHGLKNIK